MSRRTLLLSAEALLNRFLKFADKVKERAQKSPHEETPPNGYSRHRRLPDKSPRSRHVRFRGIRTRIQQRWLPRSVDPEKRNERVYDSVLVGNQDDAGVLNGQGVTRVFHLDRKTIVLQPFEDRASSRPPQFAFHAAYEYDPGNFIKDFEVLCRIMCVEAMLGNKVLIYRASAPTREEESRVKTLVIAYGMYSGRYCIRCVKKTDRKPFRGVRKDHEEQIRVWDAMIGTEDQVKRMTIYEYWKDDKQAGRKWKRRGERRKLVCAAEKTSSAKRSIFPVCYSM